MSPGPRRWRRATAASRPARSRSAARSSPIWPGRASPRWPASSAGARSPARPAPRSSTSSPACRPRRPLRSACCASPGTIGASRTGSTTSATSPSPRIDAASAPVPAPGIAAQLRHHPHPPGRSLNLRSPRERPGRSRQRHHPRDRARSLNDPGVKRGRRESTPGERHAPCHGRCERRTDLGIGTRRASGEEPWRQAELQQPITGASTGEKPSRRDRRACRWFTRGLYGLKCGPMKRVGEDAAPQRGELRH